MFDCQKVFAKQKALLAIEKDTEGCAVKPCSGSPNNCIVWHTKILLAGYCLQMPLIVSNYLANYLQGCGGHAPSAQSGLLSLS